MIPINSKTEKKLKHGFERLVTPTHIHLGLFRFDKLDGPGLLIIKKKEINETSEKNLKTRKSPKSLKHEIKVIIFDVNNNSHLSVDGQFFEDRIILRVPGFKFKGTKYEGQILTKLFHLKNVPNFECFVAFLLM